MHSFNPRTCILLSCVFLLVGCAGKKKSATVISGHTVKTNQTITTPSLGIIGRVASVNKASRFVVLSYPIGSEPSVRQKLNVYRNSLKVAELLVTGPQRDGNTVADIVVGEAQIDDEVRED